MIEEAALADLRDVVSDMVGECHRYAQAGTVAGTVIAGMAWASVSTYSHREAVHLLAMAVVMLAEYQPAGAGEGGGQDG